MKKNLKLVLALIMAAMMIVASISAMAAGDTYQIPSSDTSAGDLGIDATIKITGLEQNDNVNLYRVLEWVEGTGWKLSAGFEGLSSNATIQKLLNPQKDQGTVELTKADAEAIYAAAKSATAVATGKADADGVYTYDSSKKPGMYIALVEPAKAGVVYNPIIVSADFSDTNSTNEIDSSATLGSDSTAVAKRKDVTVEKTEPVITNDINEVYEFTVNTTIPVYAATFTNTFFNFTDKTSEYLDIVDGSIEVKTASGSAVTPTTGPTIDGDKHGFSMTFDDAYIKALPSAQDIVVTYKAKLAVTKEEAATLPNVKEEYNRVTIEFPNNPEDNTSKTILKDETREYTFTIDGKLFGNSEWNTLELVKVGLDSNGNPVESVVDVDHGVELAALDGAVFGLYTDAACTTLYTNDAFDGKVTTANNGLLFIPGLDADTYYLKEISAPAGYIKDSATHTITITADINGDEDGETGEAITEYYDNQGKWYKEAGEGRTAYTYYVPVLNGYTVKVDNAETSYNMTLSGPSISSVTVDETPTSVINTKGVELPSTGGIGTTIFYVGGSILVLAAAILLVTKRRMGVED